MKKKIFISTLVLILIVLTYKLINNSSPKIVKIAQTTQENILEINEIKDKKSVSEMENIYKNIVYLDSIDKDLKELSENKLWIEVDDEREINISFWTSDDTVVIFNNFSGKYGYINEKDIKSFKEISEIY